MISIRKYLDGSQREAVHAPPSARSHSGDLLSTAIAAYRSVVTVFGRTSAEICPAEAAVLQHNLERSVGTLEGTAVSTELIRSVEDSVQVELQAWAHRAARHFQAKAADVKNILMMMARTAESVGERDDRCAQHIEAVTTQLKQIASLDDLSEIRNSIEKSAVELKNSIDRMTAESREALSALQQQVSAYRTKLEEAEQLASCDALTGLYNRLWIEDQIERRMQGNAAFCAAIIDINEFKFVNDDFGHMVGDELLKQFSRELRTTCRTTDVVGRWGGDEFILLLDCGIDDAEAQIERLSKWVCGSYALEGPNGPVKLQVQASVGLAEWTPPETMSQLLDRADTAMYRNKADGRTTVATSVRR